MEQERMKKLWHLLVLISNVDKRPFLRPYFDDPHQRSVPRHLRVILCKKACREKMATASTEPLLPFTRKN